LPLPPASSCISSTSNRAAQGWGHAAWGGKGAVAGADVGAGAGAAHQDVSPRQRSRQCLRLDGGGLLIPAATAGEGAGSPHKR
jgi:hypothetical protein